MKNALLEFSDTPNGQTVAISEDGTLCVDGYETAPNSSGGLVIPLAEGRGLFGAKIERFKIWHGPSLRRITFRGEIWFEP